MIVARASEAARREREKEANTMKVKDMTNTQLLLAYENALCDSMKNPESETRAKRWKRLFEEVGKRMGMTAEEIEETWANR